MKAMVLAAGRGSRLGPVTDTTPKCLMKAGDGTLIEHVLDRLAESGVREVVVNLHYLSEQVRSYLEARERPPTIRFSPETELLDTGGGVYNAREYFTGEELFLVHNADIYSEIDLRQLVAAHRRADALATLAVRESDDLRRLLFDSNGALLGWENRAAGTHRLVVETDDVVPLGFCGISVLSPKVFDYMEGLGEKFSLITPLLEAAAAGEAVLGKRVDDDYWIDMGTPDNLEALRARLSKG